MVEDEPGGARGWAVESVASNSAIAFVEADGAAAALRLLAMPINGRLCCCFTDVVMPEVNGAQAGGGGACACRPDLKVLFTTGYTRNAVVHNGVVDAGVELIGKPFTVDALAAKVRSVLDG